MLYGDSNTFCYGIEREAIEASVRCKPRQRLLRALDVLLLQGFRRLRRGYTITRTSHWKDLMQDLTASDLLAHMNEGWQALDMGCDLSRNIFRRAWALEHSTTLIRKI